MNLAYLERVDPARNILCFYAIRIVPTLFGEWAVVRESGRIGSPGRERQSWFASAGEVVVAGLKAGERKNGGVIEELVEAGFSGRGEGLRPFCYAPGFVRVRGATSLMKRVRAS